MKYLGFQPTDKQPYYFISYNSEDDQRISPVAVELDHRGVSLWCDYGIPYDDQWEAKIAEKIDQCDAVILFYTKQILEKENSYVIKEHKLAREYEKKVHVVCLDSLPKLKGIAYKKMKAGKPTDSSVG